MTFATVQTLDVALREHLGALQARDVERFAATLARDAAVVDGHGTCVSGVENVVRSHAEWFASPLPWRFDYEVVHARENARAAVAVLRVAYRETPDAQPSNFVLSLVFERQDDGSLKMAYDQNTPLV